MFIRVSYERVDHVARGPCPATVIQFCGPLALSMVPIQRTSKSLLHLDRRNPIIPGARWIVCGAPVLQIGHIPLDGSAAPAIVGIVVPRRQIRIGLAPLHAEVLPTEVDLLIKARTAVAPIRSPWRGWTMPLARVPPVRHAVVRLHLKLGPTARLHPDASRIKSPRPSLDALGLAELPSKCDPASCISGAIVALIVLRFTLRSRHRPLGRLAGVIHLG